MAAVDLTGNLESFSLFGLLQFLSSSHASGILQLSVDAGEGKLVLGDGEIFSACFVRDGRSLPSKYAYVTLEGEEAALALLEFTNGKFEFAQSKTPLGVDATAVSINVPALLMEAARIADELERLAEFLPRRGSHLSLVDVDHVPSDPLECGLSTVFATLAACPAATVDEIESKLGVCPQKVRIAIAQLARFEAFTESTHGMSHQRNPSFWWAKLLTRHLGGIRVVVASSPYMAFDDYRPAFDMLSKVLEAPPAEILVLPDSAMLARIRPQTGGLLSLILLPMLQKHRQKFARVAATTQLVLLSEAADTRELTAFREQVPAEVPVLHLQATATSQLLVEALADYATQSPRSSPG